jgi:hypothetical protein
MINIACRRFPQLACLPKFLKLYQRAITAVYLLWALIVVVQSLGYYSYFERGRKALTCARYDQAELFFRLAVGEVEHSPSYQLMGERDFRHAKALAKLALVYRSVGKPRLAQAVELQLAEIAGP